MKKVNKFFKTYLLHDDVHSALHQSDDDLISRACHRDCPRQHNGYDCGIFALAVTLHLSERVPLASDSFTAGDVTAACAGLANSFHSKSGLWKSNGDDFRACFPGLRRGRDRRDGIGDTVGLTSVFGDEDREVPLWIGRGTSASAIEFPLTPPDENLLIPPTITPPNVPPPALLTGGEIHDATTSEGKRDDEARKGAREGATEEGARHTTITPPQRARHTGDGDTVSTMTADSQSTDFRIFKIMKDMNVDSFPRLEDIDVLVDTYEQLTGNRLTIHKSTDKFRVYRCRQHLDCTFQLRFSKTASANVFCLKNKSAEESEDGKTYASFYL